MSLDPQTILFLKEKLEKEKSELENDLSLIANPVNAKAGDYETKFDIIGEDMEDNAEEVEQYADNLAVEETLEEKLKTVNGALEKIANNRYGFCEICQKPIETERLKVNPSAKTCVTCQK